ncbi:MAG: copper amine oxidase N-terminal domain-containing protein, partial [Moorella sp. (in: Bacteria)]|nr:copper amine oxidase N-terminal domain-containing protein [Moorella sp. (in: firmicutes)]
RFLSNALGVRDENIFWFGNAGRVVLQEPGFNVVELTVGRAEVLSNGEPVPGVDAAPMLRNARTFLPARFVANALGYDVDWDPALGLVVCWPKGEPKPDVSAVKAELKNWKWNEYGYRLPDKNGELIDQKRTAKCQMGQYWTKAGLEICPADERTDLELLIMPPDYNGSLEAYDQAEAILASRFGQAFAGEVMAYARQKMSWKGMLPEKWYLTPTG